MELLASRYQVLATVRRAPSSLVLRALDLQHDRVVALKVYPLSVGVSRADLLAEAGTLLRLEPHPGLPTVRDDFFLADRYVIVMDWVEGTDLVRVLGERGAPGLTPSTVLEYVSQAAGALDHLHGQVPPVVHGDVKPSNLILTPTGRVTLVDFGIATATGARATAGTRGFTAPEVAAGGPSSPAADVYGLAATAVALLTGRPPAGSPPQWDGIDPDQVGPLARALRQALATDPTRRPASAGEFAERLRGAHGLPTGVVTLLATELVEANSLWETDPDTMATAADRLDDLTSRCVEEHGGRMVRSMGEGDRTLSAFAGASGAVLAALALHRRIANERWPGRMDIRLRAALHSGEVELRHGAYIGPTVSRVDRLRSLAPTSGTAVSLSTVNLIGGRLPAGARLVELTSPSAGGSPDKVFRLLEPGAMPSATVTSSSPQAATQPRPAPSPARTAGVGGAAPGLPTFAEALARHRLLTERAARLLADQHLAQTRLDRASAERAKMEAVARHALTLAAHEERHGNQDRANGFNVAAETFAHRLVVLDREVEDLHGRLQAAIKAAEDAKVELDASAAVLAALRSPGGAG